MARCKFGEGALLPESVAGLLLFCCLVINEIAFAPPANGSEYVELVNTGAAPIDLGDAAIYDSRRQPRKLTARPLTLPPGGYVVLVQDPAAFATLFPGVPYLEVTGWPSLNNGGDLVGISIGDQEVDAVQYEASWSPGDSPIERVDPKGPSSHRINWRSSPVGGTPGGQNAVYAPDLKAPAIVYAERFSTDSLIVVFSEPVLPLSAAVFEAASVSWANDSTAWVAGWRTPPGYGAKTAVVLAEVTDLFGNTADLLEAVPVSQPEPGEVIISERLLRPVADPFDGVPDQDRFLEIWNAGPRPVAIRGLRLQGRAREDGSRSGTRLPFRPRSLGPGETVVITPTPHDLRSSLALPAELDMRPGSEALGEDVLALVRYDGLILDQARYSAGWHDPLLEERGRSLTRIGPDGLAPLSWRTDPGDLSPGRHHALLESTGTDTPRAVITEVLFEAPDGLPEFVELMARSAFDANGLHLVIDRSPGEPDSTRVTYAPTWLQSGDLLTVVFPVSGRSPDALPDLIRASYPGVSGVVLPAVSAGSLRNSGVILELRSGAGLLLDRVALTPEQHAPALGSTTGYSLERVDPEGASSESTNWMTSAAPEGASPGRIVAHNPLPDQGPADGLEVSPRVFDPAEGPVSFTVPAAGQSQLVATVFDRAGRQIRSLRFLAYSGQGRVYWDGLDTSGRRVRSGVYVVLVHADSGDRWKSVVVVARRSTG